MSALSVSPRRRIGVAVGVVAVAVGLVAVTSVRAEASDAPYPPTSCVLSVGSASSGDTVSVAGSGYPADTAVSLAMTSHTSSLGSARVDTTGGFRTAVTIPAAAAGSDYSISASAGGVTCTAPAGASAGALGEQIHRGSAQASSAHSGGTASTGFAALTASVIALALLGGGLLFVLLGRRRRQL